MNKNLRKILVLGLVFLMIISTISGCKDKDIVENNDEAIVENANDNESLEETFSTSVVFNNFKEEYIRTGHIMDIINVLSSNQYKGRLSGTEENVLAFDYIANYFNKLGLESPESLDKYKQKFNHFVRMTNGTPKLELLDAKGNVEKTYKYIEEHSPVAVSGTMIEGEIEGEGILVENIDKLNSDNEDLKDKILLLSERMLQENGGNNVLAKAFNGNLGIKGIIYEVKLSEPMKYFAVAPNANPGATFNSDNSLMVFRSESEAFNDLLESSKKGNKIRMTSDFTVKEVESYNVIGTIPGSDENLKDEYILITGHMDHVGDNKDGTYNPGALDNASGTSSLMEIARIIKENNIKPKKTIVFIAFNGEEEGLWGSRYYTENPIYPLDKTTVINLDMVGSTSEIPLEIANFSKAESNLRDELYRYSKEVGIDAVKSSSQGSDHYPFGTKGVEAVLLIHFDRNSGYHSPEDTIESVSEERIKEVVKLVLYYLDKKAF